MHGAFTWGVLDKLLEDGRLSIEAISATSAGAMNAVVAADGLSLAAAAGRAREAQPVLAPRSACAGRALQPRRPLPWEKWLLAAGPTRSSRRHYLAFQAMTHMFSPYQINPFNFNPLKDVLVKVVDFDRLRALDAARASS